ncbi:hypothetical protein D9M69_377820 [compost metagenome]
MNAAHLLDRVLSNDPETAILIEVPLASVALTDDDVMRCRVFLATPGPAIACYDAGLVAVVLFFYCGMQSFGRVEHLELVFAGVELLVGSRTDI